MINKLERPLWRCTMEKLEHLFWVETTKSIKSQTAALTWLGFFQNTASYFLNDVFSISSIAISHVINDKSGWNLLESSLVKGNG